ncbi:ribosome-binding protein 1-like [Palaemon carinicauda]|uniref:ribosome-binding protein 1-like n=1 Tax=Palaemon carinicauda TaxID=392227 RepID=UPI0035B632B8
MVVPVKLPEDNLEPNAAPSVEPEERGTMMHKSANTLKKQNAPNVQQKKQNAPNVQQKNQNAPNVQKKNQNAPNVQKKNQNAPNVQKKNQNAPNVQKKNQNAPNVQKKNQNALNVQKKKQNANETTEGSKMKGLTPYQGNSRACGMFYCEKCNKFWFSGNSWANCYQKCKGCNGEIYPYAQFPPEKSEGSRWYIPPHPQHMCQKCKQLRRSCVDRY